MEDSKKRYNELTRFNSIYLNLTPKVSIPKLKENDYTRGYVVRYFTQKANDLNASIYEISKGEYNKLSSTPMYITTNLRWRISGSKDPSYSTNGTETDMGVRRSNKNSIALASEVMINLKMYLPNLSQFHKI